MVILAQAKPSLLLLKREKLLFRVFLFKSSVTPLDLELNRSLLFLVAGCALGHFFELGLITLVVELALLQHFHLRHEFGGEFLKLLFYKVAR